MKSPSNFTKGNTEYHRTEERAWSLLFYYDLSHMEVGLDWNFNYKSNSPWIPARWFIKMEVIDILPSTSAEGVWVGVLYQLPLWEDPRWVKLWAPRFCSQVCPSELHGAEGKQPPKSCCRLTAGCIHRVVSQKYNEMGVRHFLSTLSQTTSVSHSLCCRQLINLLLSRLGIWKLISPYINTAILQKSINNKQQPTLLIHFQAPLLFSIYLPVLLDPFSTALLQQGPGKAIISAGERRWLLWHSRSDIIIVTALSGLPNL